MATLQFCARRSGGELTELLPWTWASSARQWLFESSTESRQKNIALARVAVHPLNRGGIYPQPGTARNLGVQIMTTGFNGRHADHEGVCVEEIPFLERTSSSSIVESYAEYNIKQCDHQFLGKCFSAMNDIMYGSLSHSHLLLVLLAWANGADWKV